MRIFSCQNCGQLLFFENTRCERCGHRLGFVPERRILVALEAEGENWVAFGDQSRRYRFCANAEFDACNWLIEVEAAEALCGACRYNRTIPDLSIAANRANWQKLELAKHRLFYTILKLRLPLLGRDKDPERGLAFDFLADPPAGVPSVMTGHNSGVITVALSEADSVEREDRRARMGETYRTLLGHFRHEIGHYFWNTLVGGVPRALDAFRAVFGDERADYAAALKAHYDEGPPPDWQERFISAYASAHPWEDFAESWAHYLHIIDALETASAFGLRIHPKIAASAELHAELDFDPHAAAALEPMIEAWLPLTFAVNSLNRSLGQPDLYPFTLTGAAIDKLRFIHGLIRRAGAAATPGATPVAVAD